MSNYETITNRIIAQLESGVIPWRRDWNTGPRAGLPLNKLTGKKYRGINVLSLLCSGFASNEWLTYKQAQEMGAQVRKGETGTMIVFWSKWTGKKGEPVTDNESEGEAVTGKKSRGFLKPYWVFNVSQIDGLTDRKSVV